MTRILESLYAALIPLVGANAALIEMGLDKHAVAGINLLIAVVMAGLAKYLGKPTVNDA